jgi:hypothetical protein
MASVWHPGVDMSVKKVTVNLPEDQVEFLQKLAAKENLTFTDVLRRSINSERFLVEQESKNRKILIDDGSKIQQVIRRS